MCFWLGTGEKLSKFTSRTENNPYMGWRFIHCSRWRVLIQDPVSDFTFSLLLLPWQLNSNSSCNGSVPRPRQLLISQSPLQVGVTNVTKFWPVRKKRYLPGLWERFRFPSEKEQIQPVPPLSFSFLPWESTWWLKLQKASCDLKAAKSREMINESHKH